MTSRLLFTLLAAWLLALPASRPANADPLSLELPVACSIGTDYFVQNYFDHVPGEGEADFTCGPLVYDGHRGTDIRTRTLAQMWEGVDVLAAAPGIVVGTRDFMDDVFVGDIGRDALDGLDAGNGVRIDHGDGWFTQYAHMMKGSIVVEVGDRVEAGDVLGKIGLSGNTEFPHLHLGVSHNDVDLDPFTGTDNSVGCGEVADPLWSADALAALAYVAGGTLQAGFAGEAADYRAAREGDYDGFTLKEDSAAFVFWAEFFGVLEGDRIRLVLEFPDDYDTITDTITMERNRAQQFNFVGRRLPVTGWPQGVYQGTAWLLRTVDGNEVVVATVSASTTFDP